MENMTLVEVALSEHTAQADAPRTFDDYVRERSVALQRFAYLITRHHEDARDVVQDALLGLYPRWEQVSASGRVDAYVRRSIANAAVSRWRRSRRLVPVEEPEVHLRREAADRRLDDAVTDAQLAWSLLGELPKRQRTALVLRYFSDASFAEIGDALDCPEATARSHVHRALGRLRARLEEVDHD